MTSDDHWNTFKNHLEMDTVSTNFQFHKNTFTYMTSDDPWWPWKYWQKLNWNGTIPTQFQVHAKAYYDLRWPLDDIQKVQLEIVIKPTKQVS